MVWIKRSLGLLATLLGVAGILVCLVGAAGVWRVRGSVDDAMERVFGRIDDTMSELESRAEGATERITMARDSLRQLNQRVQQRVGELRAASPEEAAGIDELERALYARIDRTRDGINFMQTSVNLVEQIVEIVESSAMFLDRDAHAMNQLVAAVQAGHEEMEQVSALFEQAKSHLVEIRAKRNLSEHAKQFTSLYSRLDTSLAATQRYANEFASGVTESRAEISNDGAGIRRWLAIGALLLTLVLFWMGLAQLCLAIHGWKRLGHRKLSE